MSLNEKTEVPFQIGAVEMILFCPSCHQRHIDDGEFATKPHHTHACQHCGMVWRPAIVCTVGVQFLPGFKNQPATEDNAQQVYRCPVCNRRVIKLAAATADLPPFCRDHSVFSPVQMVVEGKPWLG